MTRLIGILLSLFFLATSAALADEITQQLTSLQNEEPRLVRSVTVWRPALLVGDLLEQVSEQTGVRVYAEDSDGAASEIVLVYVKDLPLSELMESLASLLSEKGAVWEWRKTLDSKGQRGYRLIRTRQAASARARQRNRVRDVFLRSVERALSGNVKNDPGAENLLSRFKAERNYIRANTTPAQRRAAIFLEKDTEEIDGVSRSWHRGWLFPTLEVAGDGFWDLNECEEAKKPVLQDMADRWIFAGDSHRFRWADRISAHTTEADALESIARSANLPVLARRSLFRLPSKVDAGISLQQLLSRWNTGIGPFYLSKFRGRSLLISEVMVDDDRANERLRLPWNFYKSLREKLKRENSLKDSLETLCWLLSHVPSDLVPQFAQYNSQLVPLDLFTSLEMVGHLISDRGMFSPSSSGLLLASLAGQSSLIQLALKPEGLSFTESPSNVQEALRLMLQMPHAVLRSTPDVVRWRMELKADSEITGRKDFDDRARQWRYRRTPARWSGSLTIFLEFEGEEEMAIRTVPLHSSDLEFLSPPGVEKESVPQAQR